MYLLAPFILQNWEKKCSGPFQSYDVLLLSSTYWPFSLCKISKRFLQRIELWRCVIFGPKMVHLPLRKVFFWKKLLISFSSTYWPLSFCKTLKKFLEPIQSYEDVPFLGSRYPNLPWTNFFGTNRYYYFHLPIGPFHSAKYWKNS